MSDTKQNNNSFAALILQELKDLLKSIFPALFPGKKEGPSEEGAAPDTAESTAIPEEQPAIEPTPPTPSIQKIATAPRKDNTEERLEAAFSEKMQARNLRRQSATKIGDSLKQKYAEEDLQTTPGEEELDEQNSPGSGNMLPTPEQGKAFAMPPVSIFNIQDEKHQINNEEIARKREQIQDCLDSFLVDADVGDAIHGPRVTMFKVHLADGVPVNNVTRYENEICMRVSAETLRILAPVPGYDYIGIEVPNDVADTVHCGSIMQSASWSETSAAIPMIMGRDIAGEDCIMDLAKAPHLLVAGTTGSGKSVCLNLFISSLVTHFAPDELRLLLVDPKVVEMQMYSRLPHLMVPVINDVELVIMALHWLVDEMERRYRILALAGNGIVNIRKYNSRQLPQEPIYDDMGEPIPDKLPYIVLIIDELGDIMLSNKQDVETSLARLAQKSRAIGIHTIVATQRPSVDVITGNIKANFPTRIAFKTASQFDSRTILDNKGAESLLGRGDMIYKSNDGLDQRRIQCAMVTDEEIEHLVDFWAEQASSPDSFELIKRETETETQENSEEDATGSETNDERALLKRAIDIIVSDKHPTISYLQRRMGIGYNKAATLIETMEKYGIISPPDSQKHRQIMYDSVDEAYDCLDY